MRSRSMLAAASVLFSAALLAGCAAPATPPTPSPSSSRTPSVAASPASPTPTPAEPTTPALSELRLSPDGLGTLQVGKPIDPLLATYDPFGCRTPENEGYFPDDDPFWSVYVPNYPQEADARGYERYPFEPHHADDGTLRWLRVQSPEILTTKGIHIGSTREEVIAAYPEAQVVTDYGATVYGVDSAAGRLVIEVLDLDKGSDEPVGTVWTMRLQPLDFELTSLSFGDAGGWCSLA